MTNKTVTYNPLTHKIVPINPTYEMVTAWHDSVFNYEDDDENVAKSISNVIAAAPEYQESSQWISVEERLPDENGLVIILYWPYNNQDNAQIAGQVNFIDGGFFDCDTGDDHHWPSHWMPLPPAPEGDDHIGDANKMVKTPHVCAFSRSVLDGDTETCSCGAWR